MTMTNDVRTIEHFRFQTVHSMIYILFEGSPLKPYICQIIYAQGGVKITLFSIIYCEVSNVRNLYEGIRRDGDTLSANYLILQSSTSSSRVMASLDSLLRGGVQPRTLLANYAIPSFLLRKRANVVCCGVRAQRFTGNRSAYNLSALLGRRDYKARYSPSSSHQPTFPTQLSKAPPRGLQTLKRGYSGYFANNLKHFLHSMSGRECQAQLPPRIQSRSMTAPLKE